MWTYIAVSVGIVAMALVARRYVIGPLQMKSIPIDLPQGAVELLDAATLPAAISPYFDSMVQAMLAQGFMVVGCLTRRTPNPKVTAVVILLVNRNAGDSAQVNCPIVAGLNHYEPHIAYASRFDDGRSVQTHNAARLRVAKPVFGQTTTGFSAVTDPRVLYELHKFIVRREDKGSQKVLPPAGGEIAAIEEASVRHYESQASLGLMCYNPAQRTYYPTWYGAFYYSWLKLWPFRQICTTAEHKAAERVMDEFNRVNSADLQSDADRE
jgi:hypothetical protein